MLTVGPAVSVYQVSSWLLDPVLDMCVGEKTTTYTKLCLGRLWGETECTDSVCVGLLRFLFYTRSAHYWVIKLYS